jgi:hypothetical protein
MPKDRSNKSSNGKNNDAPSAKFKKTTFSREKVFIESQEELDVLEQIQKEDNLNRRKERLSNKLKTNDDELIKFNKLRESEGLYKLNMDEYVNHMIKNTK